MNIIFALFCLISFVFALYLNRLNYALKEAVEELEIKLDRHENYLDEALKLISKNVQDFEKKLKKVNQQLELLSPRESQSDK